MTNWMIASANAQTATTTATPAGAPPSPEASLFGSIAPLLLIFVVFYFFLIKPQQRKMKEHQSMLGALRRGDKVITGGGILGTVNKIEEGQNIVVVEIAPEVKVRVERSTIVNVLSRSGVVDVVEGGTASTIVEKKSPLAAKAKPANDRTAPKAKSKP